MYADLHLHTNFSDGTYTPEELAGHGKRVAAVVTEAGQRIEAEGALERER